MHVMTTTSPEPPDDDRNHDHDTAVSEPSTSAETPTARTWRWSLDHHAGHEPGPRRSDALALAAHAAARPLVDPLPRRSSTIQLDAAPRRHVALRPALPEAVLVPTSSATASATATATAIDHDEDDREAGQATAEYALVLLGAAAIALLIVSWATKTNVVGKLLDVIFSQLIGRATGH